MNYFELFVIEPQYDIDMDHLNQQYIHLQQLTHPDQFAHSSAAEQLVAVQKSAMVNEAYQILKEPVRRAEYLLTIAGIALPNEQQTFQDPEFLMLQMELREGLSYCENEEQCFNFRNEIADLERPFLEKIKQLLSHDSIDAEESCLVVQKLKFLRKLYRELDKLEEELI